MGSEMDVIKRLVFPLVEGEALERLCITGELGGEKEKGAEKPKQSKREKKKKRKEEDEWGGESETEDVSIKMGTGSETEDAVKTKGA